MHLCSERIVGSAQHHFLKAGACSAYLGDVVVIVAGGDGNRDLSIRSQLNLVDLPSHDGHAAVGILLHHFRREIDRCERGPPNLGVQGRHGRRQNIVTLRPTFVVDWDANSKLFSGWNWAHAACAAWVAAACLDSRGI